jgi:hypothetical protein
MKARGADNGAEVFWFSSISELKRPALGWAFCFVSAAAFLRGWRLKSFRKKAFNRIYETVGCVKCFLCAHHCVHSKKTAISLYEKVCHPSTPKARC